MSCYSSRPITEMVRPLFPARFSSLGMPWETKDSLECTLCTSAFQLLMALSILSFIYLSLIFAHGPLSIYYDAFT